MFANVRRLLTVGVPYHTQTIVGPFEAKKLVENIEYYTILEVKYSCI